MSLSRCPCVARLQGGTARGRGEARGESGNLQPQHCRICYSGYLGSSRGGGGLRGFAEPPSPN